MRYGRSSASTWRPTRGGRSRQCVDRPRQPRDRRHEDQTPGDAPDPTDGEQRPPDRPVPTVATVAVDPPRGLAHVTLGEPELVQVEGLPRLHVGPTVDPGLDPSRRPRTKGAVSVVHEDGAGGRRVHPLKLPGDFGRTGAAWTVRKRYRLAMSETLASTLRAQLEEERASLQRQLNDLGGVSFDEGFADSSQVAAEQGEVRVLTDNLRALLTEIEHALGKFDADTFGVCEVCGEAISEPRLEAMPATRYCVKHA